MKKLSKRQEEKIVVDLQVKQGYMFQELPKSQRSTMMMSERNPKTKKMVIKPAVCIKLIVPADSWLGGRIVADRAKPKAVR